MVADRLTMMAKFVPQCITNKVEDSTKMLIYSPSQKENMTERDVKFIQLPKGSIQDLAQNYSLLMVTTLHKLTNG